MELILREVCKLLFSWWWFGMDGQTKTADKADRLLLPALIVLSLSSLLILMLWNYR